MNNSPFTPGLPPNLVPNPPGEIPEAQTSGDAMANMSPFREALDVDAIIANLTLDRPLKLFIPNRDKMPDYEFRIINSIPQEIAAAHNKGWREVTNPELASLFQDLVAGTDKAGHAFRPILMSRPKRIGDIVRKRHRAELASLYAGMDPMNKELGGKYTAGVDKKDGTFLNREGSGWRIRV
jgi:hypothetical protein